MNQKPCLVNVIKAEENMLLKILNLVQKSLVTLPELLDNFLHKIPLIRSLQPKTHQHLVPLHRRAQPRHQSVDRPQIVAQHVSTFGSSIELPQSRKFPLLRGTNRQSNTGTASSNCNHRVHRGGDGGGNHGNCDHNEADG